VVSPHNTITADVLIDGELIAGITAPGTLAWSDAREIDATGCYVFPGVVDPHTHIQLDTGVYKTDDNWEIGTKSAAFGGVTTVVDFATQFKGQTFRQALDSRLAECKPAYIDYGLHMMVTDLNCDPQQAAHDLAELRDMGVPSIKLYTTYRPNYYADDATILHTLRAMPADMLAMFHCENDAIVADATARLVEQGKTGWRYHGQSRPAFAETEAALRVVNLLPDGKSLYVVHCSYVETAKELASLRQHLINKTFYYETCIQYLLLSDQLYEGEHPEHFILQPPLRQNTHEYGDYHPYLLPYCVGGEICVISTDHCDYSLSQKVARNDFRVTPGGLPGLETLLPLTFSLFNHNVDPGFAMNRLVELLSTNPAKLFGLYPQKGVIQIGSDADIVIYDPAPEVVVQQKNLHTIGGYCPYEGMTVQGRVRTTISRGHVLVHEGKFFGIEGRGQFLHGKPFKPLEDIK
jgi:dihydropyrimidinase